MWARSLLLVFILSAGCGTPSSTPVPVAPGATLEIFTVAPTAGPGTVSAVDPGTKATIHLESPAIIVTPDVHTVAKIETNRPSTSLKTPPVTDTSLQIVFTPAGASKMQAVTSSKKSMRLAIVVNGNVISVPNIVGTIGGTCIVSGNSSSPDYLKAISALTGMP